MPDRQRLKTIFHLHMISDATGETLNAVSKAAMAQFEGVHAVEHVYALVRSDRQLDKAIEGVGNQPGIVLFTLVDEGLRARLLRFCAENRIPCVPVMDSILNAFQAYLGIELSHRPGGQHQLDAEYFERMDALAFTITHDDGQMTHDLEQADIVLLGISRTSKTPTSIYLAHRGIKAANVPLVPGCPLPPGVDSLRNPLVVGLVASPERLLQIRRNRLLSLSQTEETEYVNVGAIRDEVIQARQLFERLGVPVIDVTRRSVEETAAAILNLYSERREQ